MTYVETNYIRLICFPLDSPVETGGETRSTDKTAWETWFGGHQPGPAGRPGVAENSPHERDHCELTVITLSCWLLGCLSVVCNTKCLS